MDLGPVRHPVTRRIWGRRDTVLLVFAGAAAEFATNRAVDWLFVTGDLPRDPIGRMFRTVGYAQGIAFADASTARESLARIRRAHAGVERARADSIPMWAHRAVLYMLIDYSERAARALGEPLSAAEQEGLYADFRRIGEGLGIEELPPDYVRWREARMRSIREDLAAGDLTAALYDAYRRQLGPWRYAILRQVQAALVPSAVARMLRLPPAPAGRRAIDVYRLLRAMGLDRPAQRVLVPARHWDAFLELDRRTEGRSTEAA
jgi:uncharacterized protein (DUF2236 family)